MSFSEHSKALKMTRTLIYFLILLFIFMCRVEGYSKAGGRNSRDSREDYKRGGSYNGQQQKLSDADSNQKNASAVPAKRSGGLGAWGYVAIILAVICAGTGLYYFFLFYPILCKKDRNYDTMELSSV